MKHKTHIAKKKKIHAKCGCVYNLMTTAYSPSLTPSLTLESE